MTRSENRAYESGVKDTAESDRRSEVSDPAWIEPPRGASDEPYQVFADGVLVDRRSHSVRVDGNRIALSPKEFVMLEALIANAGRVVSHARLAEVIWGFDNAETRAALGIHLAGLQAELPDGNKRITSIDSVGFRFETNLQPSVPAALF